MHSIPSKDKTTTIIIEKKMVKEKEKLLWYRKLIKHNSLWQFKGNSIEGQQYTKTD